MPRQSVESYMIKSRTRAVLTTSASGRIALSSEKALLSASGSSSAEEDDPNLIKAKQAVANFDPTDTRGLDGDEADTKIRDRKDEFMRTLQHEKNEVVEFLAEIEYAKREIQMVYSNRDLLRKAAILINQDWLGHIDGLSGNIYTVAAFGSIWLDHKFSWDKMFTSLQMNATAYAKFFGCLIIMLIQFIGPPLVVISKLPKNIGALDDKAYDWRCWPTLINPLWDQDPNAGHCGVGVVPEDEQIAPLHVSFFVDWQHIMTTKILGLLFMILFMLNGLFVVLQEKKTFRNIYNTFRFLKVHAPSFEARGRGFLMLGSLVNNWVVMWSCVGVFLIVGASRNPSDLLLDALGLLFLYNIDDIGGDLAFLEEDEWPGQRLGWIYEEIVSDCKDDLFDEDVLDWYGWFAIHLYTGVSVIIAISAVTLPLCACFMPFLMIVPSDD